MKQSDSTNIPKKKFELILGENISNLPLLYGKPMYLSLIDNNSLWFHNLIYEDVFLYDHEGIYYKEGNYFSQFQEDIDLIKFDLVDKNDRTIDSLKFIDCSFNQEPLIRNKNIKDVTFINCDFKCDIYSMLKVYNNYNLYFSFENCEFSNVSFLNFDNNTQYYDFKIIGGSIKKFEIKNQTFSNKFSINRQSENNKILEIDELEIWQTTFKNKFKIHNCNIKKISIKDTDFENNADFFKCSFLQGNSEKDKNIYFKNINFDKLAIFDENIFKEKVYFNYVTFNDYSNFKKAIFENGLDLILANFQNDVNFYGIEIKDTSATSQETFRIIKYQFEKIGNKIEANKYHSLELNQNRRNIWETPYITFDLLQRGVVSFLHYISSNHSQSWLLVLLCIFVVSLITNISLEYNLNDVKCYLKYMTIFPTLEDFHKSYAIMVFNKISLGYLYYQLIITIRKDTRK